MTERRTRAEIDAYAAALEKVIRVTDASGGPGPFGIPLMGA